MEVLEYAGLLAAAFVAGAINAVAGGGSLISFPALIAFGYSSKTANVTNTIALWPGYVGGSLGYREELKGQRGRLIQLAIPNVAGAAVGTVDPAADAGLRVRRGRAVPDPVRVRADGVPGPDRRVHASIIAPRSPRRGEMPWPVFASMFLLGIYGAYFGAALGIMTLAVFTIFLAEDIQRLNALKGVSSLIINAIAVVGFMLFGPVRWLPAAVMAVGAIAGGYLGVGVARRLGRTWLRIAVISYGCGASCCS